MPSRIKPRISILVAARKNSKYLAKFLFGLVQNTERPEKVEVLVMLNVNDTWNRDLEAYFSREPHNFRFFNEDYQLGRAGLHKYLNELYQSATGEWIVYFCEDHYISYPGWDTYVYRLMSGQMMNSSEIGQVRKHNHGELDPDSVWCIIPKFDNCGAMNQILSRGYTETIGGVGRHGWIDSYINDVNQSAFGDHNARILRTDTELFHDFTHDDPSPMSDAHMQSVISEAGQALPEHGSEIYRQLVAEDAEKLRNAIRGGK